MSWRDDIREHRWRTWSGWPPLDEVVRVRGRPERGPRSRLEAQSARWESGAALHFSIECPPSPAGVGQTALSREPEPDTWLLGYWIVPDKWGQGFATECASAVLELATDELRARSVWAGTAPSNQASRRVLSKLGFEFRNENPCGYTVGALEVPTYEYEFVVEHAA